MTRCQSITRADLEPVGGITRRTLTYYCEEHETDCPWWDNGPCSCADPHRERPRGGPGACLRPLGGMADREGI